MHEKRKSFQLDLEDALTPPPISLSAPELSSRYVAPFKPLRHAVSSTELIHERAMARFYKVVAMKEEQNKNKETKSIKNENNHIPNNNFNNVLVSNNINESKDIIETKIAKPEIKIDTIKNSSENSTGSLGESKSLDNKWQSISFDEDYTASTVSTDGEEYSDEDEGSLNEDVERGNDYTDEETYNPRDKLTRPSSVKSTDDEENEVKEELKILPLPDPNFIPKPILKKRETDKVVNNNNFKNKKEKVENKEKKDDRMTIFKKITKMPVQKPFSFPKILNKKDTVKSQDNKILNKEQKILKNVEKIDDHLGDEGKTVIDYYGNIVKEYGSQRRPNTPLYLNTEDLKKVAEEQQSPNSENQINDKETIKLNKTITEKPLTNTPKVLGKPVKNKTITKQKTISKKPLIKSPKQISKPEEPRSEKKESVNNKIPKENANNIQNIQDTQVLLKTTERATIVIPIDYKKLEERAKVNVRTAIDYTVDICLLLLAFWVYLFKDERLAVPFLILIIYRQLQETIIISLPEWTSRYTPSWLKKKNS